MKHIEKAWVRVLIAFLLGAVLREIIFISTGDPNRPKGDNYNIVTLALVVGLYIFLTYYSKNKKSRTTE